MKIYHNPHCSKSRAVLELLKKEGEDPEVINYLEDPLSREELCELIGHLNIRPIDIVRTDEPIWREKHHGKELTDDEVIDALIADPILIQRPIVVRDKRAVLARPPERALELV